MTQVCYLNWVTGDRSERGYLVAPVFPNWDTHTKTCFHS